MPDIELRVWIARVLQVLIVTATLASAAMLTFRAETQAFRMYLISERRGCDWLDAVSAIPYTAELYRRIVLLGKQSRLLRQEADGNELWRTPDGDYWAPSEEKGAFFEVAELESQPYSNGAVKVARGDVVLDCGAHIGLFTRQALTAGASLVVAVEPGRKQIACLKRNFPTEIAQGRVIVCEKGVWNSDGQLRFDDTSTAVASFVQVSTGPQSHFVPVTTIDTLVSAYRLDRVNFIKMDIEGAEHEALAGAVKTMARFRPRLAIASYHRADDPERIPELVHAAYPQYRVRSAGCRLDVGQIRPLTLFFAPN